MLAWAGIRAYAGGRAGSGGCTCQSRCLWQPRSSLLGDPIVGAVNLESSVLVPFKKLRGVATLPLIEKSLREACQSVKSCPLSLQAGKLRGERLLSVAM